MGSFVFVRFIQGRRWIHSGSLGSFGYALGVVVFFRVQSVVPCSHSCSLGSVGRWVHSGAIWGSLGLFGFIRLRPGSFGCAAGVVGFIRVHWVNSDVRWCHLGSLGSFGCALIRVHLVHSCAPWGSVGSFRCALLLVRLRLVHSGAPRV